MKHFSETQAEFVAHLRDPANNKFSENVDDRRLKIYRELFFNNILGFLDTGFPVLKSIHSAEQWQILAREFFRSHQCHSPFFVDISREFVDYLSNEHQFAPSDHPFIPELAHYEWLELAMSVKKSEAREMVWSHEMNLQNIRFSDVATLAGYKFPVHQISCDYLPQQAREPVFIVVYRDIDNKVGFTVVNQITAHLLTFVKENPGHDKTGLTEAMVAALPNIAFQQLERGTEETLIQLLQLQILKIGLD